MTTAADPRAGVDPRFAPTAYTAALLQVLRRNRFRVAGAAVVDIGCGGGAILGLLAELGAASLCGIDVERDAVDATRRLLDGLGNDTPAELCEGDLFAPVRGRRFDLIAANLPHFPMSRAPLEERLATWSWGGDDGRVVLDRVVEQLSAHLSPGGVALMTHNGFVGLERTRILVELQGLGLRIMQTQLVHLGADRLERLSPAVRERELFGSLLPIGPHVFAEVHVVAIGTPAALGTLT